MLLNSYLNCPEGNHVFEEIIITSPSILLKRVKMASGGCTLQTSTVGFELLVVTWCAHITGYCKA